MTSRFEVKGFFYRLQDYSCRKYLDIKKSGVDVAAPDLMAVMMNPGSAGPVNGDDNGETESEVVPDATQRQLTRVMDACDFAYARLINLSDLRESKSARLFAALRKIDAERLPHSIFDPARRHDFDTLFLDAVPVLYAWGVDKRLEPLAKQAMSLIDTASPVGIQKPGVDYAFYHPLPPHRGKQNAWVDTIRANLFRYRGDRDE